MGNTPIPNKIARHAAWQAGKVRFFTGIPCKHGHIAERFVSSGGCVECVTPYKTRRNAFSKDVAPFTPATLWVRRTYNGQDYAELEKYLQQCIDTFDRAKYPELAPIMHTPPRQPIGYVTAPPGAQELPPLESLPSAARAPTEKCEHGVDAGFCNVCDP